MRPLLWLHEQRIRLTVWWLPRRMFGEDGHLTPRAIQELGGAMWRRTP